MEWRRHVDVDTDRGKQALDFDNVIAATKTQGAGPQQVDRRALTDTAPVRFDPRFRYARGKQTANQVIKGLAGTPIFFS